MTTNKYIKLIIFPLLFCASLMAQTPHFAQGKDGKYALLSAAEEALTDYLYDSVCPFYNHVAIVYNKGCYGLLRDDGKELARPIYTAANLQFGNNQFRFIDYQGNERFVGFVYHPTFGGAMWVNQDGKVLKTGTKMMFNINDKIPEKLWDF